MVPAIESLNCSVIVEGYGANQWKKSVDIWPVLAREKTYDKRNSGNRQNS